MACPKWTKSKTAVDLRVAKNYRKILGNPKYFNKPIEIVGKK